jgi:hypothetical protein
MSLITDIRTDLAEACGDATGWVTHAEPPRSLTTPCIIIMHGTPLMEPEEEITFAEAVSQGSYKINLQVLALVADSDAATEALESVIDDLLPLLKPTQVSEPLIMTYATNNYLGIRFQVTEFAQYSE